MAAMSAEAAAYALWIAFIASWHLASRWTARATSKATPRRTLAYLVSYVLGFGLLFTPAVHARLFGARIFGLGSILGSRAGSRLWDEPAAATWALTALEAAAFVFAWWARLHLGRLWSGMMTLREGHRVVDTGPYARVRHPIYTGFLGAAWALALVEATPVALAGAAILTATMAVKAKAEEALLRRELGPPAYDAYAARTPMLVPFAPR